MKKITSLKEGVLKFRKRLNKKKQKAYFKKLEKQFKNKKGYTPYKYEALSDYFTRYTHAYYNLDNTLAKLIADLLINYQTIVSNFIDLQENNMDKKLQKVIKYFKNYNKLDWYDYEKLPPKQKEKYNQEEKAAWDTFKEIFPRLWY